MQFSSELRSGSWPRSQLGCAGHLVLGGQTPQGPSLGAALGFISFPTCIPCRCALLKADKMVVLDPHFLQTKNVWRLQRSAGCL